MNHKAFWNFLFVFLIVCYIAFQVYQSSNIKTAIIVFVYTVMLCSVIFYLFQIKRRNYLSANMLAIGLGYIWVLITSMIVNDVILTMAMFGGVTIGILIVFIYRIMKRRIKK